MTYWTTSPYIVEKVTLVNGLSETRGGRLYHAMHYEHQYIYGDFNRDGFRDAAVILAQSEGGSGHFRELAFLINDGKQLVHRVSHGLGDRSRIVSVKQRKGQLVIDMFVRQEGDCNAWPTKRVKKIYDYLRPDPAVVSSVWS